MSKENFSEEELAAVIAVNSFLQLYQQPPSLDPVDKVKVRWRFASRPPAFMPSLPS